jgi:hypothetical protein
LGSCLSFGHSLCALTLITSNLAPALCAFLLVVLYLTVANVTAIDEALAVAGWVLHTATVQAPLVSGLVATTVFGTLTAHEGQLGHEFF